MTLFDPSPETAGNPYSRVAIFCGVASQVHPVQKQARFLYDA